jgi:hypothetical protein
MLTSASFCRVWRSRLIVSIGKYFNEAKSLSSTVLSVNMEHSTCTFQTIYIVLALDIILIEKDKRSL